MAAVSTGLLVEGPKVVGCSSGLRWAIPGLGLPLCRVLTFLFLCVSLQTSISVNCINSVFCNIRCEGLFK